MTSSSSGDSISSPAQQTLAAVTDAADAVDAAQEALWAARRELGDVLVTARQSGASVKEIAQAARRPDIDISNALAARGISRT